MKNEEPIDVIASFGPTRPDNSKRKKTIIIIAIILVALVVGIFAVNRIKRIMEINDLKNSVIDVVEPIMSSYGINDCKVKSVSSGRVSLYSKQYENLIDSKKFSCIERIHDLPSGGIDWVFTDIYVSETGYYYTVSTAQVVYLGYYNKAGLYYADGGNLVCVYEAAN